MGFTVHLAHYNKLIKKQSRMTNILTFNSCFLHSMIKLRLKSICTMVKIMTLGAGITVVHHIYHYFIRRWTWMPPRMQWKDFRCILVSLSNRIMNCQFLVIRPPRLPGIMTQVKIPVNIQFLVKVMLITIVQKGYYTPVQRKRNREQAPSIL